MSAKGWRRARMEPLDNLIPPIKRSLGKRSLQLLEENNVIHAWEIPSELPMPSNVLCDVFDTDPAQFQPKEFDKVITVNFGQPASSQEFA